MKIMKFRFLATVAGVLTAILTAGSVHATTFNYSYTFSSTYNPSALTVSGSLEGDPNGNLVENVKNVTISFKGTPISDFVTQHYDGAGWVDGFPVVSFTGLENNFAFVITDSIYFYMLTATGGDGTGNEAIAYFSGLDFSDSNFSSYSTERGGNHWSLTAVPEPSTLTAGLLLASLIGLHGVRSLQIRKSAQNSNS